MLTSHLEHILHLEGVRYEKNAIEVISRSGAGSVRDALTLLDQAIVFSENFINLSTVTTMLGIIEPLLLEELIDKILAKNRVGILEFISMASEFEAEMIIDELMLYLKEILLQDSHKLTPIVIEGFFRVLADSKRLLSIGSDGEFVLSLALFRMMESLQDDTPIKISKKRIDKDEPIEEKIVTPSPPTPIKKEKPLDRGAELFKSLVDKIYDRNYELGESFDTSIKYNSFEYNKLIWESTASGKNKTMLKNHWGLIRMFVQEIFGYETKIKNISKELP
jgi:DNA polymerase-3 subunit gamma/tau